MPPSMHPGSGFLFLEYQRLLVLSSGDLTLLKQNCGSNWHVIANRWFLASHSKLHLRNSNESYEKKNHSIPVFQNLCPKKQVKRPRTARAVKNILVESLPTRRKKGLLEHSLLVIPTATLTNDSLSSLSLPTT